MKIKLEIEFDIEASEDDREAVIETLESAICECLPGVLDDGADHIWMSRGFELVTLRDAPGEGGE
jgi:hypothetical protein